VRGQRPFPPYRVEVNVSADRPEIVLILDQSGFQAALGEVAGPPMPLGVLVGVSGDDVPHATRQVGLRRREEVVEVVGHEHETEQVPTEPPDGLLQCFEQRLAVMLALEDGSPEVATGHHVMDRAGRIRSAKVWSRPNAITRSSSQKPDPTPAKPPGFENR